MHYVRLYLFNIAILIGLLGLMYSIAILGNFVWLGDVFPVNACPLFSRILEDNMIVNPFIQITDNLPIVNGL